MRKINTKLFLILLVTLTLIGGGIFGLHRLQAGNIAEALLWQATQAEQEGKLDRSAKYLARYLEFAREDLDTRAHLGAILSDPQMATTPQRRARARFVIEQVLAKDPDRHDLRLRLCEMLLANRALDAVGEHLALLDKNQPASADVALLSGRWHEAQGRSAPAIEAYRRAIQLDAKQTEPYVRLVGLLKQLDFGKEPRNSAEIERLVAAAIEAAPDDAAVLSLAAQHAQEKGNSGIALKYLEDGLQQNPAEPRLYLALARTYSETGKRTEAIDKLRIGLGKVKKESHNDLRWSLANLLLDDNRLDEAQTVIREIREANTLSASYLEARAKMLRGRWFEAAHQFEKIRPALKGTAELALQIDLYLGACYEQLDEPMMQLAAYERASQTDPTSLVARRGLATARSALGQTAEALQIYRDLIGLTKDPRESALRRLDHVRLTLQNGPTPALKDVQRIGAELDEIEKALGKSLDIALLRSELHFVQGNKKKAEGVLQELIKEYPDRHEPWLALLAVVPEEEQAELMEKAETKFKEKSSFRLAQIHYWSQRWSEAAEAGLKRLEADLARFEPRERGLLMQALGETHYYAGRYADAARVMAGLVELPMHAQDARIRLQLLELALVQDDDAGARRILEDIKRIEGDNVGGPDWSFGEAMRLIRAAQKGKRDGLDQARHLLTVAAAQRPNWHPILQTRAELDELQGRPEQAIANYRRALELGSRDPQAIKQLLFLLAQAQRHDEVEQLLATMQKQQGTTDELVRYYVAHSVNRRDFKKAEYLVTQIVAKDSTNFRDHLWMGQILSASGQSPKDAEKALRRAVALAPEQPETWINLVRHLIASGQNELAHQEIENAGKALPNDRRDAGLALCFEMAGFLQDAAQKHKANVERDPTSVRAHLAAGDFFSRVGYFSNAESYYRKIHERQIKASDEEAALARSGLALALVKQAQMAKTTEALQLVGLTLDAKGQVPDAKLSDHPAERLLQAKVLGSIPHHRLRGKAITLLETIHQKNALSGDDQFFLARLLMQQGKDSANWAKARGILKALTLAHPKNPRYLAYLAQQQIARNEHQEAEAVLVRLEAVERERKATSGGFGSIELRAKLAEQRGLGTQAVTLLTDYAAQPGAAPARKLLVAHLHGRLGNFREAIDWCEQARAHEMLAHEANAAAVALLRMNRPSEAQATKFDQWRKEKARVEASLREAADKDAKNVSVRLHLADLMELQGKYDEVEKLCREVLKENENHLVALNNLAWLLGQNPATAAEALTLIDRAVTAYGPRPELLDTRAVVRLNLGQLEPAVSDLERVVEEAPTPTRLFHLCRAYERSRNLGSAQTALRQANDLGLTSQQLHPVERAEYQRVTNELSKRQ